MRVFAVAPLIFFALCLPARAESLFEAGGCFARTYSEAHLASHPNQQVAQLILRFSQDDWEVREGQTETLDLVAGIVHFRDEPQTPYALLPGPCMPDEDGNPTCGVECDGGWMVLKRSTRTPGSVLLETSYIRTGRAYLDHEPAKYEDDRLMGKARSLADQGEPGGSHTVFRLDPVQCPAPEAWEARLQRITGGGC